MGKMTPVSFQTRGENMETGGSANEGGEGRLN